MGCPPSVEGRVAVRRFDGDGEVHRTISSMAVGSSPGSARSAANDPGCSASASSPPAVALRVVSAPALNNRLKNRKLSMSDSTGSSELTTSDSMSSLGRARLAKISSCP